MRITIFISALAISLGILSSCGEVYAQAATPAASMSTLDLINSFDASPSANLGESLIYPGSPLYFLKAAREKIEVLFDSNNDVKAMRQVEFAQRRLREIASLIRHNRQDLIPETLEHYKINLKNLENVYRKEDIAIKVGEAVSEHLDVLEHLYGTIGEARAQAAVRSSIETAEGFNSNLLAKLSLSSQQALIGKIAKNQALACKFLTRESKSDSLSDTEKVYLSEQAKKCQDDVNLNLKDALMEILQQKQLQSSPSGTSR